MIYIDVLHVGSLGSLALKKWDIKNLVVRNIDKGDSNETISR